MSSHFAKKSSGTRTRTSIAVGLVVFLTLAGTAGAQALWTTPAATVTGSAKSGKLQITQTGFPTLGGNFTSSATGLVRSTEVVVTNSGTVDAPFTLNIAALTSQTLATGASVQIWPKTADPCLDTAPTGTAITKWTEVTAITGSLTPAATVSYCVRSSITLQQRYALVAQSAGLTATVRATRGENWVSTATAVATQTVANTITPGTPTANATTAVITWAAASDAAGVAGYLVYRDGGLVATTGATTLSYTDTMLTVGTAYQYTVQAYVDGTVAAPTGSGGTPSPLSGVRTLTMSAPTSTYTINNGSYCVDVEASNTTNNTRTINFGCNSPLSANQKWKFSADANGAFRIIPQHATDTSLALNGSNVVISTSTTIQRWKLIWISGTSYQIKDAASNRCLDVGDNQASVTQLVTRTCSTSTPLDSRQIFTLGTVG